MKLQNVIDEIRLELTAGGTLELEIDDAVLKQVVKKSMRELERFYDETNMVTVPFASCIDYGKNKAFNEKVSSIVKIYRTEAYGDTAGTNMMADPMFAQQWMLFSNGGTMYNLNDYVLNYAAWNTMLQMKNTMSTDLSFKDDRHNGLLYINHSMDVPHSITIEYIPKLKKVEDIKSDYWIDILIKLCVATTKIIVGRIRSKYSLSNAPWAVDGERLLEEGNTEKKELEETLRANSNLIYDID